MRAWGQKPVGYIQIAEGYFWSMHKKPCAWHRFWMRVFLGWRWLDKEPFKLSADEQKRFLERLKEYDAKK